MICKQRVTGSNPVFGFLTHSACDSFFLLPLLLRHQQEGKTGIDVVRFSSFHAAHAPKIQCCFLHRQELGIPCASRQIVRVFCEVVARKSLNDEFLRQKLCIFSGSFSHKFSSNKASSDTQNCTHAPSSI